MVRSSVVVKNLMFEDKDKDLRFQDNDKDKDLMFENKDKDKD